VVGGPLGTGYWRELNALVGALDLSDAVNWHGPVLYEDLPKYYYGASVFVLPSLVENFPHTLLEAMSIGCPVISARQIPSEEICGDAYIEIDALDVSDIANKIEMVLTNRELRTRMCTAGIRRAELYDWSRAVKPYRDAIETLSGLSVHKDRSDSGSQHLCYRHKE
jgi:glycosyltransferase involved in cell wall biosynthesis